MINAIALALLISLPIYAIDVTKVAAVTTIAVNVLTIKDTVQKARVAARKTKGVAVKVVRKVVGK